MDPEQNQSLIQKKIALAQSEHAPFIIELMKDIAEKTPLVADTEFKTIVNAITLDVTSNMMIRMVDYLERIRSGELHKGK